MAIRMTMPSTMPPNIACAGAEHRDDHRVVAQPPPRGDDEALGLCVGLDAHSTIRGSSLT